MFLATVLNDVYYRCPRFCSCNKVSWAQSHRSILSLLRHDMLPGVFRPHSNTGPPVIAVRYLQISNLLVVGLPLSVLPFGYSHVSMRLTKRQSRHIVARQEGVDRGLPTKLFVCLQRAVPDLLSWLSLMHRGLQTGYRRSSIFHQ